MTDHTISTKATSRPARIAIMGTPIDSGNRGVLALGASLVSLCSQVSDSVTVLLLIENHNDAPVTFRVNGRLQQIAVVNARMSPKSAIREHLFWILTMALLYRVLPLAFVRTKILGSTPWVRAIATSQIVGNIHGGDSFSDIYGIAGFVRTFLLDCTVLLVKGSIVQLPQTYGPFSNRFSRLLARQVLVRSSKIVARDRRSQSIAQGLVGAHARVQICPDVAFSLEAIVPPVIGVSPPLKVAMAQNVIGLNVNGLMYNGGYTENNMFGLLMHYPTFLQALVVEILAIHPGELWLVPHTYAPSDDVESDPEASRRLFASLPAEIRRRVRIVSQEYDQYQIKGLIGQFDFFIGSRMHACIAALSQGVPCVGVAYSMKFAGVFESVGMESWVVDGRTVANKEAVDRVLELFRERGIVRGPLLRRAEEARANLKEVFGALMSERSAQAN